MMTERGDADLYRYNSNSESLLALMCSSDDESHMLTVKFPEIESDPLREPYLDELNLRLLEHDSVSVFSRKADSGYKVSFNL